MQINITKTTILLTIFFLLGLPVLSAAQSAETFTLTADNVANGKTVELDKAGWKFRAGDDLN